MNYTKIVATSLVAIAAAGSLSAENVLRWTSQGDALTMDPHSQNEGPTIATVSYTHLTLPTT